MPDIARKTDKGLPQYLDEIESDVFVLSGAEDLVPVLQRNGAGKVVLDVNGRGIPKEQAIDGFVVRQYQPRVEGLFASIERWTPVDHSNDVHWRTLSRDNVLTVYGGDPDSRIADPADPARIFTWLICETRDDKGNAMVYRYRNEDGDGADLTLASERNRGARDATCRTAQRYLKRILYGNRTPVWVDNAPGRRPRRMERADIEQRVARRDWMFELVLDYGEHATGDPRPHDAGAWTYRTDAFSAYRAGFEVRTTRRCERALMFHHFPDAPDVGNDALVRITAFSYSGARAHSGSQAAPYAFLTSVTHAGCRRSGGELVTLPLPPVEFDYTQAVVRDVVHDVDTDQLVNLPAGVDGIDVSWTDLHGEGIPGLLVERAGAWYYKRNLSPISQRPPEFSAIESVASRPNRPFSAGAAQFMDLGGDGHPDLVVLEDPAPGFHAHDDGEGWEPFRPFEGRIDRDMRDPDLRFVDLDGDGLADILVTEDDVLTWYPSLGARGFGPAQRRAQSADEERGPRVVFADGTDSIYLADLSGDGLADLVRIRVAEVCYWPNLGYGRFGAKVTMDNAPRFDTPDHFDPRRLRIADIDGSGTADLIYLHRDGVRLYFNQCGNGWSDAIKLKAFPAVENVSAVAATDLLGNGTAALVWSSPLPGAGRRQMRYVDLMGGTKPHLLVKTSNNLGAETRVSYAPSTRFYLQDKLAGRPWITRLPFPVHVVETVETRDYVSRNRFIARYAYHHGHFDGTEREFRGFGMIEQFDTEQIGALVDGGAFPLDDNVDAASYVPPVLTRTWFHTGLYLGRQHVSDHFAGIGERLRSDAYFREPGLTDDEAREMLLHDTVLPGGLSLDEEREACRALKGAMLRQEVYALDGSARQPFPYAVTEQSFTIRALQPQAGQRHGVFFTHACETLSFHYERDPSDPRVQHALTLEVDDAGNVLKSAAVGYGRRETAVVIDAQGLPTRVPNPGLAALDPVDRAMQLTLRATFTEQRVTNSINDVDVRRNALACESVVYELTRYLPTGPAGRFQPSDFVEPDPDPERAGRLRLRYDHDCPYEDEPTEVRTRRPIEQVRTLYRSDDLATELPLGKLESMALAARSFQLAFTPGLLQRVFRRPRAGLPVQDLLPDPAQVLGGAAADQGGYVASQALKASGAFPASDANGHWWIPSGQTYFSAEAADQPAVERAQALLHFFVARRHVDPFGQPAGVTFDADALLMTETYDALGNRVTVDANDYRVLQPRRVADPNGNRTEVAFDTLGRVAGTAIMGKPLPARVEGDSLAAFDVDPPRAAVDGLTQDAEPRRWAEALLRDATTRVVYDVDRFQRTRAENPDHPEAWLPACAVTLARETHASDPLPPQGLRIQLAYSWSDGLGREIQKKTRARPGPLVDGGPAADPRWLTSGWIVYDNKGQPVRPYEPFFSASQAFEFGVLRGVSPVLFRDPVGRVVATLHPNATYEKVVFGPWHQAAYDVNDTVAPRNAQTGDPRTDPDVAPLVRAFFAAQQGSDRPAWSTWYQQRATGALGADDRTAALRSAVHADTPTTVHFDALGRAAVTVALNRYEHSAADGTITIVDEAPMATRIALDIEGNQREVRDAIVQAADTAGRIVMQYDHDVLGNRIRQSSMEAGARWTLADVGGRAIRSWDSRGHDALTRYDALRRPFEHVVRGNLADADSRTRDQNILVDRIEYGETVPDAQALNLRTRVYRHFDGAGVAANTAMDPRSGEFEAYDFKGNLLRSARCLAVDYAAIPDWSSDPAIEAEVFTGATRYDALNRAIQSIAPHSSLRDGGLSVIQPTFDASGLLAQVDVWTDLDAEPGALVNAERIAPAPVGVTDIAYDAKGQRQRIDYKNGVRTTYAHDPLTFRLSRMRTRRDAAAFPGDCPARPSPAWPGCGLQDIVYTYDPMGNITHIRDDAQQTIYFRSRRVDPVNDYVYDAFYRLVQATGREHLGQGGAPIAHSWNDAGRVALPHPGDGNAMGRYVERYAYDAVGNFVSMQHERSDAANPGWSRTYDYQETSLIEDGADGPLKISNRLSSTLLAGAAAAREPYAHDVHGNMVAMPHLSSMQWDFRDQLLATARQISNDGTSAITRYVYDASGQRIRKVLERKLTARETAIGRRPLAQKETITLGGFEVYREYKPPGNGVRKEVETLHLVDDSRRIAIVESRTRGSGSRQPSIQYQLTDHLGSTCLQVDEHAGINVREEYTPNGSTSYRAVRRQIDRPPRYRFMAKERDEESGLDYFGARYYASWLGRWTQCDPAGINESMQLYAFAAGNPVKFVDPDGRENVLSAAFLKGAGNQLAEKANSLVKSQALNLATGGAYGLYQAGVGMVQAYREGGGGGYGVLNAVNTLNPMNTLMTQGWLANEEAGNALYLHSLGDVEAAKGHAEAAGAATTNYGVASVELGMTVASGVGLARTLKVPGTTQPTAGPAEVPVKSGEVQPKVAPTSPAPAESLAAEPARPPETAGAPPEAASAPAAAPAAPSKWQILRQITKKHNSAADRLAAELNKLVDASHSGNYTIKDKNGKSIRGTEGTATTRKPDVKVETASGTQKTGIEVKTSESASTVQKAADQLANERSFEGNGFMDGKPWTIGEGSGVVYVPKGLLNIMPANLWRN